MKVGVLLIFFFMFNACKSKHKRNLNAPIKTINNFNSEISGITVTPDPIARYSVRNTDKYHFYEIHICKIRSKNCQIELSIDPDLVVMLPQVGDYYLYFKGCFSEKKKSCELLHRQRNIILKDFEIGIQLKKKFDQVKQEINSIYIEARKILRELKKTYQKRGTDKLVRGIDYVLSLNIAQSIDVLSEFQSSLSSITTANQGQKNADLAVKKPENSQEKPFFEQSANMSTPGSFSENLQSKSNESEQKKKQEKQEKQDIGLGLLIVASALSVGELFFYFDTLKTGENYLTSRDHVQRQLQELGKPQQEVDQTTRLARVEEGISEGRASMLIERDLNVFGEIKSWEDPRIISMVFNETTGDLAKNIEAFKLTFYESMNQRLRDHGSLAWKDLKMGLSVNTSGVHWETIFFSLDQFPKITIEHYNFLGGRKSLDEGKISSIQEAIRAWLQEIPTKVILTKQIPTDSQEKIVKFTGEIPSPEEIRQAIKEQITQIQEVARANRVQRLGDNWVIKNEGDRFYINHTLADQAIRDEVILKKVGDDWKIAVAFYAQTSVTPKLSEMSKEFKKKKEVQFILDLDTGGFNQNEKFRQGTNNCGVASAWIIQKRGEGSSVEDIKTRMRPEGYHQYREKMLDKLNVFNPESYPLKEYSREIASTPSEIQPQRKKIIPTDSLQETRFEKSPSTWSDIKQKSPYLLGAVILGAVVGGTVLMFLKAPEAEEKLSELLESLGDLVEKMKQAVNESLVIKNQYIDESHLSSIKTHP